MELIHGDCLEKMKDIPDKSIDMILCDLPYGSTACKWDVVIPFNKYVQIGKKVVYEQEYVFDKMKSGVSYKEALEDFLSISKDGLWDNYKRIIKDRGAIVLFGSEPFSSYLRMSNIKQYKYDWVWNKKLAGNGILAKIQPLKIHEIVHIFGYGGKVNYYPQMVAGKMRKKLTGSLKISEVNNGDGVKSCKETRNDTYYPKSIIEFSMGNYRRGRLHPTQKSTELLEYLIKTYTLEGETVLDNCAGSFSTSVACDNTNRNWICIEKEEEYCNIGLTRINDNRERLSLPLLNSINSTTVV